jgi:hypothetical protein
MRRTDIGLRALRLLEDADSLLQATMQGVVTVEG